MALRTWLRAITTAFGVAAFVGAVQLGAGYGLQLVRLRRDFVGPTADFWPTQLSWLAWFAIVAAVVGACVAQRVAEQRPARPRRVSAVRTAVRRVVLALVAAIGAALAVVGLSVLPAQASTGVDDPVTVTALIGGIGAVVGLPAALAALTHPAMRWNMLVFSGALWLLAVGSVAPDLWAGDPVAEVRPGVLEPVMLDPGDSGWQLFVLLPALALVLGAAVSGLARWRTAPTVATAVSGMAGPAVLDAAYLAAGAGRAGPYQDDPYWAALLAVAAGVVGSITVAAVRRPGRRASTATGTPAPVPASGTPAPAVGATVGPADSSSESRESVGEIALSEKIPADSAFVGRVSPGPAAPPVPDPPTPGRPTPDPLASHPPAADPPTPSLTSPDPVRSGPVRSGPVRSGPVRSGPVRSGPTAASPVPVAAQSHPGDRPPPVPAAVTPRVDPTPIAPDGPPTPTPTPVTDGVDRPTPKPVAPPPVAPQPVAAPPTAPAAGRIPRPRFMRQRRPAPPPALTDEDAEHVDWVSELRRQPRRADGRNRNGAEDRNRNGADSRSRSGADDQANGR
ncbi:hypothetical protein [Solwaraspora sp. WMMD792]|uniref:hypothetical protein n=1 Tax=Solwaraspora sp. WMMD792 TaxID=3016099 RepID=UPI002416C030|nr:hypothetical protein [Solwaraspora sp. WMMD792]MDG4774721.1 hypothetical protein [Solwaraspora sp. WMMD792]